MGKESSHIQQQLQLPEVWAKVRLEKPDFQAYSWCGKRKEIPCEYKTPNDWFNAKFPRQADIYGPSVLQITYIDSNGFQRVIPMAMNELFFGAALAGADELGVKVVYYPPDSKFYFFDPIEGQFFPTTENKIKNLLSGYIIKCAASMPPSVAIQTLFVDFRKPERLKAVVELAKSILAVDESYFGEKSPFKRVDGSENTIRQIRKFVDESVQENEESILTATDAYKKFCIFCSYNGFTPLERKNFMEYAIKIIREKYGLGIRKDILNDQKKYCEAWKGLRLGLNAKEEPELTTISV